MEEVNQPVNSTAEIGQSSVSPFLADNQHVSMSLDGAQEKQPLFRRGRSFCLPKNGAPSNCILKPQIPDLSPSSTLNEYYCLKLGQGSRTPLRARRYPAARQEGTC